MLFDTTHILDSCSVTESYYFCLSWQGFLQDIPEIQAIAAQDAVDRLRLRIFPLNVLTQH